MSNRVCHTRIHELSLLIAINIIMQVIAFKYNLQTFPLLKRICVFYSKFCFLTNISPTRFLKSYEVFPKQPRRSTMSNNIVVMNDWWKAITTSLSWRNLPSACSWLFKCLKGLKP